jgi:hypothetical protein
VVLLNTTIMLCHGLPSIRHHGQSAAWDPSCDVGRDPRRPRLDSPSRHAPGRSLPRPSGVAGRWLRAGLCGRQLCHNQGDFDGCWEAQGVNASALDPVLLDFTARRAAQKAKYGGELFIANTPATPGGTAFLDFFQTDKLTGERKGIIAIDLGDLP